MVSETDIFYKIVYGLPPKKLMNYFNTNNNPVYKTRTEHDNVKIFERINWKFQTINFSFLCQWMLQMVYFLEKSQKY